MDENSSKEKENDENNINIPKELLEGISRTNLEEKITHWSKCPSFIKSEKNIQNTAIKTAKAARFNSLLRLTTLYNNEIFSKNEINLLFDSNQTEILPLFQIVPAPLIQVVTSGMSHLLGHSERYIEKIFSFFDDNPTYSTIFACMTFPSIHFYFIATDLLEL